MEQRKNLCEVIHNIVNTLNRYDHSYSENDIPLNGIYIIFEKNEKSHNGDRIVHIGTHSGQNRLVNRLDEIFKIENKDRSILRKNIGRSILNKNKDPYIDIWDIDFTSIKNREKYIEKLDKNHQIYVEKLVTEHIKNNLSFVVIEIENKENRIQIKKELIGEISNCNECKKSQNWLGNFSTKDKIIDSSLWHEKELYKSNFTEENLLFINKNNIWSDEEMKDNTYIFICNNDKWNFFDNVKNEGHIEPWKCTKSVKLGDKFYIHLGGNSIEEKGIIATGTVVSESYIDIEEDCLVADLQIEKIFDRPVLKFKQGMYQVQGSCARLREETIEEIEKAIELSLAENI